MKNQNVLVISHRRSGTHLTIDSVRNNFKSLRMSPYVTLETLDQAHPDHLPVSEFRQAILECPRVIKVHYLPDVSNYLTSEEARCAEDVFSQSKKIYVVRNGLDVLASLYEFRRGHDPQVGEMSFSQFIREPSFDRKAGTFDKVTYWAHHVESWLNAPGADQMLVLRFEQWVNDYRATIKKVAQFFGLSKDWFGADVRMGSASSMKNKKSKQIQRTWVEPRKGEIGDHVNYFTPDDLGYFRSHCADLMKELGYSMDDGLPRARLVK